MQIYVQFVISKDTIAISLESTIAACTSPTVLIVKGKIRDDTGFRLDMMQLTHHGTVLQDDECLSDHCIGDGAVLRLAIKAPEYTPHPSQKSYDGFLGQTKFVDMAGRDMHPLALSHSPTIILQGKADKHRSKLDLQSLLQVVEKDESVVTMQQTFGHAEAKKRGFVQWTSSHLVYERVMLLELSGSGSGIGGKEDSARQDAERRRYCYDGQYRGGDRHSWQRYTRHTPVPCTLRLDNAQQQLHMIPSEPLKPAQEYVILLMHGGKIIRSGDGDSEDEEEKQYEQQQEGAAALPGEDAESLEVLSDHLEFFATAPLSSTSPVRSSAAAISSSPKPQHLGTSTSSLNEQVEFQVSHHYSSHPAFTVALKNFNDHFPVKCLALKKSIYDSIGLPVSEQQLVINGQICLNDEDDLSAFHLQRHSHCPLPCTQHSNRVQVLPLIAGLRDNMSPALHAAVSSSIMPFLQSVFPADGTRNVSTHVLIQIQFQSTCHNVSRGAENVLTLQEHGTCQMDSRVNLQCFVEASGRDRDRDMEGVLGVEEARRRGFNRWLQSPTIADTFPHSPSIAASTGDSSSFSVTRGPEGRGRGDRKLYLLEVTGERKDMLRNRYEFSPWKGRNGHYRGGDCHSWQRYTQVPPLPGELEVFPSPISSVIFRPSSPLKPDTAYVVVVTNGVDIISQIQSNNFDAGCSGGDLWSSSSRTEDDALFFFTTEPERAHNRGSQVQDRHLSGSQHSVVEGEEHCSCSDEGTGFGGVGSISMCYGLGGSSDDAGGDPALCIIS